MSTRKELKLLSRVSYRFPTYTYELFNEYGQWDNGAWYDTLQEAMDAAEAAYQTAKDEIIYGGVDGWRVYENLVDGDGDLIDMVVVAEFN